MAVQLCNLLLTFMIYFNFKALSEVNLTDFDFPNKVIELQ